MKKRIDFKELKQRVTMEQILIHYALRDHMTGTADQLRGRNPFDPDADNTTRFSVSLRKNCWNVWGTELSGNVIDFVKEKEQTTFLEAVKLLDGWFPANPASKVHKSEKGSGEKQPKAQRVQEKEQTDGGESNTTLAFSLKNLDSSHPYLYERGLSDETIAHFGIGHATKGILKDRIAIPIYNTDGELVAYIGRHPGVPPDGTPRYRLPKGFKKSLEIFNLHRLESESPEPLVIVEGVFDCFHIWQLGWHSVVALMGSSLSEEQEKLIRGKWSRKILLTLDNDDAGTTGTANLLSRLGRTHWVKAATLPNGIPQPDSLTKDQLDELIAD